MPRFYSDDIDGNRILIHGPDARHIAKVLRMNPSDHLTVCDAKGMDYQCVIEAVETELVRLAVLEKYPSRSEPDVQTAIFQGVPKGDKMEWMIQKSVELGVSQVTPVLMKRSVSRPDAKAANAKHSRYQRVALEAAKQSGRGIIPYIGPMTSLSGALDAMGPLELKLLLYEAGGSPLKEILLSHGAFRSVGVLIGPEGGFEPEEVEEARCCGCQIIHLGERILRCETAPLCILSALMYHTGNL